MHAVADRLAPDTLLDANIRLVKEIHALLRPAGKVRLAIDGTLTRAWLKQVDKQDSREAEAAVRGRAQKAGPRYHGKQFRDTAGGVVTSSRFVRGYDLIVLVDLTTGLPLTWTLWDANRDEAKALKLLLFDLYERWPDLEADVVVADAAWDENWAAEWCLNHYGLHLVARRHPSRIDALHTLSLFESKAISLFRGDGQAICREHNVPLIRDGIDGAARTGLAAGDPNETRIRLRYHCPSDPNCGRPGLAMEHSWTSLAYYPHRMEVGRADLHAERIALSARRNACEALFSAIKVGNSLALDGPNRTRTNNERTIETLLSLALLMRSATMLADQRIQRDLFPADPPPDLADALKRGS